VISVVQLIKHATIESPYLRKKKFYNRRDMDVDVVAAINFTPE
jgi:hypothetical protein